MKIPPSKTQTPPSRAPGSREQVRPKHSSMDEAGLGDECRHRTQRGGASGLRMRRGPKTRSTGDVDGHAFISRPLLDTSPGHGG